MTTPAARAELTPTGKLRVGIDFGNELLTVRMLDGRFTAVQQAACTPKNGDAAAQYLREFVEDAKSSGLVAQLVEKNGVRGVSVAPPA
jgi:polar amino acid transport system substrate-binding protein